MTQRRHLKRKANCHPDRAHHALGLCRQCWSAQQRREAGAAEQPRGLCPGCEREVVLLPPSAAGSRRGAPQPWRRKAHAVRGDLGQPGTMRCRYDVHLTPEEIPET